MTNENEFIDGVSKYFPPHVIGYIRLGYRAGACGVDAGEMLRQVDEQCGNVESGCATEKLPRDPRERKDGATTHGQGGGAAAALSGRPGLRPGYFKQHWQQRTA